jgi:hypothetical protein
MELLVVVIAILLLDLAAARWGYDSRDLLRNRNDPVDGFDV